jgi:hypothetical protein
LQEDEKTNETKNKEDLDKKKSKKKRGKKKKEPGARNAPSSLPPLKTLCCKRERNAQTFSLGNTSLLQAGAQRPDSLPGKHFTATGVSATPPLSPSQALYY